MPVPVHPSSVMERGTTTGAVPVAVKPDNAMFLGTTSGAVPAAVKPASAIMRGPPDRPSLVGARLGPASLAGAEVGAVTMTAPGVTLKGCG